ncbi:replication-relaxation family protein [Geobacillus thermodenitrificans]|uniref:replication-relaxation family protein n=1 Tax=Geobacillus thermodenitrificans TaxID=33940 RepID=UPI0035B5304C
MRKAIEKEQRQEAILSSLAKLDYLTRSQLQVLHNLGSPRNTSRVMKALEPFVAKFLDGEAVYYLTKEGRERTGARRIRKRSIQARHYIMRNDIYIAYGCPDTWKNEVKLEVKGVVSVVADALFIHEGRYHIVEVDHQQKMSVNKAKIGKYRKMLELGVFKTPPVFVWMTTTEYKRKQLLELCEGMDAQVFLASQFH